MLPKIIRNSYYMHKLLELMEKKNYEAAIITSKRIDSLYLKTEILLIRAYALNKLGEPTDLIDSTVQDAIDHIKYRRCRDVESAYIYAFADAVSSDEFSIAPYKGGAFHPLQNHLHLVSTSLKRALPLDLPDTHN